MEVYYGVYRWGLPSSKLCPPVPNRFNYILWIYDLLKSIRVEGKAAEYCHPSFGDASFAELAQAGLPAAVAGARSRVAPSREEMMAFNGALGENRMRATMKARAAAARAGDATDATSVRIVDVGTGASLIYPLLGSSAFGWSFVGTEIDPSSVEHAGKLLGSVGPPHQHRIRVH